MASITLNVSIPLETVSTIQNTAGIDEAVEQLSKNTESGRIVAENVRALIAAVKALPCDVVPKVKVSVDSDSVTTPVPMTSQSVEDGGWGDFDFTVVCRDLMMKEEEIVVHSDWDFGDLAGHYSSMTNMPLGDFYFSFNGKFFDENTAGDLTKV